MTTAEFPSPAAAREFADTARARWAHAEVIGGVRIVPRRSAAAAWIGALIGGLALGLIGGLAEGGYLGLPRLEPLLAAPVWSVTMLASVIGGSLGALIGSLATLPRLDGGAPEGRFVRVPDADGVHDLARSFGGSVGANGPTERVAMADPTMTSTRWIAWGVVVLTAGLLLAAAGYIWWLSMDYGNGSDQQSRIGYTLKNVQRYPASTPEEAGSVIAAALGGEPVPVAADPVAAALAAPAAAALGRPLAYGAGENADTNLEDLRAQLLQQSPTVVVIAEEEPAYALPAAYAAAHFRAPVVTAAEASGALAGASDKRILVAAPARLIPNDALDALAEFGTVERVAADGVYRHALLWAEGRWGDFGWGIDPAFNRDTYANFSLANPAEPGFAAAGLPTAWLGNYGPLLYTPRDDLEELTDQYLWRLSPDFYVAPSDGPFVNLRVIGGPGSVSYNAQARPDLAVETHAYRQQVTGLSGLAAMGWAWFFVGLVGFVWALFAIPRRLPDAGFYPRLYWPLGMLVLGPVGILAFFASYRGRPLDRSGPMPKFVRPAWARAVSATVMGMGVGMALMIASMYLFQINGMPLYTWFEFTPLFWLGSPMAAWMWFLMVVPAVVVSTLLFMGPMMADMHGVGWGHGVRKAFPVVALSMIAASIGMWTLSWWWMNWQGVMSTEDLWLWVAPLWWASFMGFLTALIPNHLLVRSGWKDGGM